MAYPRSFLATFLAACGVFLLGFLLKDIHDVSDGCRTGSGDADWILAYCQNPKFGTYEHAALYYEMEPEMVDQLRRAEVLFVGDSELLIGFSESNVDAYFRSRGIPYFILGFGYGESSEFAYAVLKKYGIKPRLAIVNADPFFRGFVSIPAREIMEGGIEPRLRYYKKKVSQALRRPLCELAPRFCTQTYPSVWRSKSTGRWHWHGTLAPADLAHPFDSAPPADPELVRVGTEYGEAFLNGLGWNRRCVVLTGVPTPEFDTPALANTFAARLGTQAVTAVAHGLATIDKGHLNSPSAEKWSAAFLARIGPVLESCVTPARGAASRG